MAEAGKDAGTVGAVGTRGARIVAWVTAGMLAGASVGALDTVWAMVRGIGGLGVAKGAHLFLLGATWFAVAGGLLAAIIGWGAATLVRAGLPRTPTLGAGLVALAGAPFAFAVAFALFSGRRAAQFPAARLAAVGLGLAGTAFLFLMARWFWSASAAAGKPAGRRRARVTAALLAVAAAGAEAANVLVLPRLYPWFHAAAAAVTVVAALLAVRLALLARHSVASATPFRRRLPAVALGLVVILAVVAGLRVRGSQTIRFAALERTAATAQLLRLSPMPLHTRTHAAVARMQAEHDLPPLPDGPRRPDSDVVVITVDALRADHVGAYGYRRRPTTPEIDKLAARSARFARAYAQAPHTSFSVASMLTGKYFPTLARLAPAEVHDPIASVLHQYGTHSAGFYPPAVFFVDAQKLKAYADSNFAFEYVKFEYLDAQKRVDQVIRYYQEEKPRHSFVWVHFFEPHEPYVAHAEFPFGSADMDRYDSEIAYVDAAVGRFLAYLQKERPGTIVVLAADHGEEFDEHGGRYHGSSLFDEQIHVPLLIAVPGVEPRVIERPVEMIDITPTVLGLLDIPVPARMRGTDLGPWLAPVPAPESRLPPAFAEVEDKRMIVFGQEKLICDLNWGFCAYHDLAADPGEKRNMADERPERAAALRAMLDEWLDGHVRFEPVLAKGAANPNGEGVPRAIERGRLGDLLAGPQLAELMLSSDQPARVRREAAQLLVALPPRKETAAQLVLAGNDKDPEVAAWASVGAVRAGDKAALGRVVALLEDQKLPRALRVRGALALAVRDEHAGVPTLSDALDACEDDVLFCRLIIIQLGKLRDRRAVPALLKHLPEVQNRREMVDALGDIGDPAAVPALLERLRTDEYVPVRAQAARALAKVGRVDVLPALEHAAAHDTEASVAAAAKEAIATLRSGRPG